MRRFIPALLAALVLSTMLPNVVGAHSRMTEHQRIVAYWTPERMANAKPKDFVMTACGRLVPNARPACALRRCLVDAERRDRNAIRAGAVSPGQRRLDLLRIGGQRRQRATHAYAILVTAGHCAYDGADGWATNWMYIPDFDDAPTYSCGSTVYGCWTARALAISPGFYPEGFNNDTARSDWAFAVVGNGGKSGTAKLDALGSYALKTTGNTVGSSAWAFGYPAAGKYHGKDLVYCNGSTVADPYGSATSGRGMRHDRRLVRRPMAGWVLHGEPDRQRIRVGWLGQLVRLFRAEVHVWAAVQLEHAGHLQRGQRRCAGRERNRSHRQLNS